MNETRTHATPQKTPAPAFPQLQLRGATGLSLGPQWPAWLLGILCLLLVLGAARSLPAWQRGIQTLLESGTYSDADRQWVCAIYVRAGVNPFEAAEAALVRTYGPVQGPDRIRLKDTRIWSVNMTEYDDQTPGLLPGHPPPEAGYPPSSLAVLMLIFGYLPRTALLPFWAVLNVACFAGLIAFLAWPASKRNRLLWGMSVLVTICVFLLWPTTRLVFAHGQFTFFSLLFALLGLHYRQSNPWLASLLFSLSLIKPALVLLFLIVPFLERNWRVFAGIALFHGALTLLVSWMVQAAPWTLMLQWMNICRYLLQGSFTFQEIYNALGWENTWISTVLTLGWFAYCTATLWLARKRSSFLLIGFLCYANLMWTYHERHDFTLLAIPLLMALFHWMQAPMKLRSHLPWMGWLVLFVLMGVGLSDMAYKDMHALSRIMRWAGRIGLWSGLIWTNIELWRQPKAVAASPAPIREP
jgi:hypothetical protein